MQHATPQPHVAATPNSLRIRPSVCKCLDHARQVVCGCWLAFKLEDSSYTAHRGLAREFAAFPTTEEGEERASSLKLKPVLCAMDQDSNMQQKGAKTINEKGTSRDASPRRPAMRTIAESSRNYPVKSGFPRTPYRVTCICLGRLGGSWKRPLHRARWPCSMA